MTKLKKVDRSTIQDYVQTAAKLFAENPRKNGVRFYPFGFLPNKYYYHAPAERVVVTKHPDGLAVNIERYDQKRSRGIGKPVVMFTRKETAA